MRVQILYEGHMQPLSNPLNNPSSARWWKRFWQAKQKGQFARLGTASAVIGLLLVFAALALSPTQQEPIVPKTVETVMHVTPLGVLVMILGFILITMSLALVPFTKSPGNLSDQLVSAQARAEKEPEKAKPAWDIAKLTLEAYFNRNLAQIRSIYYLSVGVMIVGFALLVVSIWWTSQNASNITPAVVGTAAGIITEFIGATFLFVYRSTIEQATSYLETLGQINSVGMAMQILDSLSDQQDETSQQKLIDAKITIAKLLLAKAQSNDKTQAPG